jgi:hypothetical protein
MCALISMACVLQIAEVKSIGEELAEATSADLAESGHPRNGMRETPDELAGIVGALIVPVGRQLSKWIGEEFEEAVAEHMQKPPSLLATGGGSGFTAEFLYGTDSSLCQGVNNQPHPVYGNGLTLVQSFPVGNYSVMEAYRLALSLNQIELTQKPFGYGFGSYYYRHGMIHFRSFLPNAVYRRGLLPNIYYACANRAHEMSVRLKRTDWTTDAFQKALARKAAVLHPFGTSRIGGE